MRPFPELLVTASGLGMFYARAIVRCMTSAKELPPQHAQEEFNSVLTFLRLLTFSRVQCWNPHLYMLEQNSHLYRLYYIFMNKACIRLSTKAIPHRFR